jgi:hypothetical protein
MSVQSDEDDEYLAMVEGQRFRALAAIERVKAACRARERNGEDVPTEEVWTALENKP